MNSPGSLKIRASVSWPGWIWSFGNRALALVLLAWLSAQPVSAQGFSVTDFRGEELKFQAPARRIVCLIESALSGLYMLGAEDALAGVPSDVYKSPLYAHYSSLDPRIQKKELPAPGSWDHSSVESVVALSPDLVILWSSQTEAIAALEKRGVRVFGVFIKNLSDVKREIEALGKITGREDRAHQLLSLAEAEEKSLRDRLAAGTQGRRLAVYFMWSQGKLHTSCAGSTVQDLIDAAGGRNICAHISGEHAVLSIEKILEWNPEAIIMWAGGKLTPVDVKSDSQFTSLDALKSGKVFQFEDPFEVDFWTLKYLHAASLMAAWIHPEVFRDVDLKRKGQDLMEQLYGRAIPES